MTIEFQCPNCAKLLRTADSKAGLSAKCPQCGQPVTVPAAPQAAGEFEEADGTGEADASNEVWAPPPVGSGTAAPPRASARSNDFCPTCGEPTKEDWSHCGFCGEPLGRTRDDGTREPGVPRPLEVGSILSRAWTIYGRQLGLCVGSFFVVLVIFVVMYILVYALSVGAVVAAAQQGNNAGAAAGFLGVFGVVLIAMIVLISWLQLGFLSIMLRVARGDLAEFTDLFRGGRFLVRFLGVSLIGWLVSAVASLVTFLPAIGLASMNGNGPPDNTTLIAFVLGILASNGVSLWIWLVYWPTPWLLIDRDYGVFDSIREAPSVSKGGRLSIFVMTILASVLVVGGYFACCIGLIFSAPLAALMFAIAYCDATGQLTARV